MTCSAIATCVIPRRVHHHCVSVWQRCIDVMIVCAWWRLKFRTRSLSAHSRPVGTSRAQVTSVRLTRHHDTQKPKAVFVEVSDEQSLERGLSRNGEVQQ